MPDQGNKYASFQSLLDSAVENQDKYTGTENALQYYSDQINQDINNKYADITPYIPKAKEQLNTEVKTSKADENLYGFIPGDWLPSWVKDGYNNSIEGLTYQIATGKPKFDLGSYSENPKTKGFVEDIASTLVSFLTPTDIATMFIGGGIGGLGVKAGLKKSATELIKVGTKDVLKKNVSKEAVEEVIRGGTREATEILMKNNVKKDVAEKLISQAKDKVTNKTYAEIASGATGLGFYSGLQSALGQEIVEGDIDAVKVLSDTVKGSIMGAVPVATAKPIVNSINKKLFDSTLSPTTKKLATKAIEVAEFGTLSPVISEGRMPEPKDFAHAAGVIGGMYIARKIPTTAKKLVGMEDPLVTTKEFMKQRADVEYDITRKSQIFTAKDGSKIGDVQLSKRQDGGYDVRAKIVKGKEITDTEIKMTGGEFTKKGYTRRKGKLDQGKIDQSRRNEIFGRKKDLNLSDSDLKGIIQGITGKEPSPKSKTGFGEMTNIEKIRLVDELRKQSLTKKISDKFRQTGNEEYLIPQSRATTVLKKYGEWLMQAKNRVVTPGGKETVVKVNKADSRGMVLSGIYTQRLTEVQGFYAGLISKLTGRVKVWTPNGLKTIYTEKQAKEHWRDVGRRMQDPNRQGDKDVVQLREILKDVFYEAKEAGVPVKDYRKNYFPNHVKQKYLDKMGDDILKLIHENPALESTNLAEMTDQIKLLIRGRAKFSDVTKQALDHFKKYYSDPNNGGLSSDQALAKGFMNIRDKFYKQRYSIATKLERSRKADLPDWFYERDARLVLTKYVTDAAKRTAHVEQFGAKSEWFENQISTLKKLREKTSRGSKEYVQLAREERLLETLFGSFNGLIEVDPTKTLASARARNIIKGIVDFQVGSKIGFGYATIPNVTQTLISTAVKAGYWNTFKGIANLATPGEIGRKYRKRVLQSGISNLSVFQMISGLEPSSSLMGKFANATTRLGFQQMNKANQYISAAAGYEYALGLMKAKNSSISWRRSWARKSLRDLGLDPSIKKIPEGKMLEAMYRFSRDAQLQRNVLNDPLFFNDPRFRPLVLFKRFGYRQFNWVRENLSSELARGNVLPMLRMGIGGIFGSHFVIFAKKALDQFIAGEEIFDENRLFIPGLPKGTILDDFGADANVDMSEFTWSDFFDHVASVGAMGFIGDIVANENKMRAIEFLVKPAIFQDFSKAVDAYQRIYKDIGDYGVGAGKRSIKYIAPIFGTIPRRISKRFETEGQRETYTKYRQGIVKGRILDYLIDGDVQNAKKTLLAWNRANQNKFALFYEDISIDAITDRLIKKYEKRAKP